MPIFKVRVSAEVARTATQSRRRKISTAAGMKEVVFGPGSTFLSFVPREVAADPHLLVEASSEVELKLLHGRLLPHLPPLDQPAPGSSEPKEGVGQKPAQTRSSSPEEPSNATASSSTAASSEEQGEEQQVQEGDTSTSTSSPSSPEEEHQGDNSSTSSSSSGEEEEQEKQQPQRAEQSEGKNSAAVRPRRPTPRGRR